MICASMGGLVKRGADADPEADPHRFWFSQKLLQVFKRLVKRDADAEANPEADPHRFSLSSLSDSRYLWVRMSGWILNNQEFEAESRRV